MSRYDAITIVLHWMLAILLISLIGLGWYMMSIEDQPNSGVYFNLHKSLGLIAAALITLKIVWRINHTSQPLPASVPRWQVNASRLMYVLLYGCMIIMPLTGFLGASYSRSGVAFFGWPLPEWANKSHAIAEQFFDIHGVIAWVLAVLIVIHLLAALKHLFIDKDGVFQRMWF